MKVLEKVKPLPEKEITAEAGMAYTDRRFCNDAMEVDLQQVRHPEAHIAAWENYLKESESSSIFHVLRNSLPQFWFPVQEGISQQKAYADATRRGWKMPEADRMHGLNLSNPSSLKLILYESLAGLLPVLITGNRQDFVLLMQAFTCRSEPKTIPESMGACMLAGFNNWNRIHRLRKEWEKKSAPFNSDLLWRKEFKKILPQKQLYQDRFMVLSRGAYSAAPAAAFKLNEEEWNAISLALRLEHECTHFFTKRIFRSMENHLYDEIIADFMGITGATGRYPAVWAQYFFGLEDYPNYREGGRLQNYVPLEGHTQQEFMDICRTVKRATDQLEEFYKALPSQKFSRAGRCAMLLALAETAFINFQDAAVRERLCERFLVLYDKTISTHDPVERHAVGIVLQDLKGEVIWEFGL